MGIWGACLGVVIQGTGDGCSELWRRRLDTKVDESWSLAVRNSVYWQMGLHMGCGCTEEETTDYSKKPEAPSGRR